MLLLTTASIWQGTKEPSLTVNHVKNHEMLTIEWNTKPHGVEVKAMRLPSSGNVLFNYICNDNIFSEGKQPHGVISVKRDQDTAGVKAWKAGN